MSKGNLNDTILQALNYYDKAKYKFFLLTNNIDPILRTEITKTPYDSERNIITLYHNNNKILKSKYEIIGLYDASSSLWVWAWAIPYLTKNENFLARKLINYAFDISDDENITLKSQLITSRFKITNFIQIEIFIALAQYLTKSPFVYAKKREYGHGKNKTVLTEYLFLLEQ